MPLPAALAARLQKRGLITEETKPVPATAAKTPGNEMHINDLIGTLYHTITFFYSPKEEGFGKHRDKKGRKC